MRRFSSRALASRFHAIPRWNTRPNTRSTHCALASQVKHTQGELSADRDRRDTLFNNIGILEPVVLQIHRIQTRYGRHADTPASSLVSYARGKVSLSAAACCVPVRCSQSRLGPCCV